MPQSPLVAAPKPYRDELTNLSKDDLVDLAWDLADVFVATPEKDDAEIMRYLRGRIDAVLTYRTTKSRH